MLQRTLQTARLPPQQADNHQQVHLFNTFLRLRNRFNKRPALTMLLKRLSRLRTRFRFSLQCNNMSLLVSLQDLSRRIICRKGATPICIKCMLALRSQWFLRLTPSFQ
jgi:hypothetical protein